MVLILLDTGLRIESLLELTRDCVDLERLVLRVHARGDKIAEIPISPSGRSLLYAHLKSHQHRLCFCTRHGGHLNHRNVLRQLKALWLELGIPHLGFHRLRRTFACNWVKQHGNLEMLRCPLHEDLRTTQRYLRGFDVETLVEHHLSPLQARK